MLGYKFVTGLISYFCSILVPEPSCVFREPVCGLFPFKLNLILLIMASLEACSMLNRCESLIHFSADLGLGKEPMYVIIFLGHLGKKEADSVI